MWQLTALMFYLFVHVPGKPWTPAMCSIEQEFPVTESYVRYCVAVSPQNFPHCEVGKSKVPMMSILQAGASSVYFEVLDCSWHAGLNPRERRKR